MKLLRCDGAELTVYDLGAALYQIRVRDGGPPIKHNGWQIVEDDAARELAQELRSTGLYDAESLKPK